MLAFVWLDERKQHNRIQSAENIVTISAWKKDLSRPVAADKCNIKVVSQAFRGKPPMLNRKNLGATNSALHHELVFNDNFRMSDGLNCEWSEY